MKRLKKMVKSSNFRLDKSRRYHFPHNSAIFEEFNFLLHALDPRKTGRKVYSFKEICKILLVEEVKAHKFEDYHPKPYHIFTRKVPPDLDTLVANMKKLSRNGRQKAIELASKRKLAFRKFLKDPERYYHQLIEIQYKPTKNWRANWVEFVRDYADLAAYCGMLPCYFKNPLGDAEEDGYVVSDRALQYLEGTLSPESVLMGMKYSNSSINLKRYPEFNIEVRPFYAALKLLNHLESKGISAIDKKLLGAAISCLRTESEIEEAADLISNQYGPTVALFANKPRTPSDFVREGERFSLSLVAFLEACKLVSVSAGRHDKVVKITDHGRDCLKKTVPNSVFYNRSLGAVGKLTPLAGYLLKLFTDNVTNGNSRIDFVSLQSQLALAVSKEQLTDILESIKRLQPSPIDSVTDTEVILRSSSSQYAVNPIIDYSSYAEAAFVEKGISSISSIQPIAIVNRPNESFMERVQQIAESSAGSDYEDVLTQALKELNKGNVVPLGHHVSGQRYTDIVWEIPIFDTFTQTEKKLLILIDAKSGDAIRQFDERVAMDDIRNTLKDRFSSVLPQVAGVWIWIIDGNSLPASDGSHGGSRPGSKTFEEKMNGMLQLMADIGRLVVVVAMNVGSFIEYYKYLYGAMSQVSLPLTEVKIPNFWIWGPAFRPLKGYSFLYDDDEEMKRKLS